RVLGELRRGDEMRRRRIARVAQVPVERREEDESDENGRGDPQGAARAERAEAVGRARRHGRDEDGQERQVGEVRMRAPDGETREEPLVEEEERDGGCEHPGARWNPSRERSGGQDRPLYWPV